MPAIAQPILYTFRRCPYAMRARMALIYSGINTEVREVVLKDKPVSLLSYSAKGTVPVLITPNQTIIAESVDIMCWAIQQADPDNWLCRDRPRQQVRLQQLIECNDLKFKPLLDKYKYSDYCEKDNILAYRQLAHPMLQQLELILAEQTNLLRDTTSMADIALFPFIRQFAAVDSNWFNQAPYPHLQTWLARHCQSVLFAATMNKYSQWHEADKQQFLLTP